MPIETKIGAAHRRRAVFDQMAFGTVPAHGLADFHGLKASYHRRSCGKPDRHGGKRGQHRP